MQNKVPPPVIAVVIVLVLAVVGFFAYKSMFARSPSVSGIGPGGKPMSKEDIANLANRMSGGKSGGKVPGQTR